jgi:hypothetical protein
MISDKSRLLKIWCTHQIRYSKIETDKHSAEVRRENRSNTSRDYYRWRLLTLRPC